IDLVFGEKLRQICEALWRVEVFRGMPFDVTVEHQELVKTARRTDGSRDRRRRKPLTRKTRDPLAQVSAREFEHVFSVLRGPGLQAGEISLVTGDAVLRQSFFNLDVGQEFLYEIAVHSYRR